MKITPKDFEKKYQASGGFQKLLEFRSLLYTHQSIAKHFGVSRNAVRLWMIDLFGAPYDVRKQRAEVAIRNMVEFAQQHSYEDFRYTFRRTVHYNMALKRCKQLKIYE